MKQILLGPWTALITLAIVLAVRIADPAFVESVKNHLRTREVTVVWPAAGLCKRFATVCSKVSKYSLTTQFT